MAARPSTIGERIRQARHDFDPPLEAQELARLAGIHRVTISRIENGRHRRPSIESLERIARVLEIPADDLIDYLRTARRRAS